MTVPISLLYSYIVFIYRLYKTKTSVFYCSDSDPFTSSVVFSSFRKLTKKQRSLLLIYAEQEKDVHGTVNGVNVSAGQC